MFTCNVWVGLRKSNKGWWSTPGLATARSVTIPRPEGNGKESLRHGESSHYKTRPPCWSSGLWYKNVVMAELQPNMREPEKHQLWCLCLSTFQYAVLAFVLKAEDKAAWWTESMTQKKVDLEEHCRDHTGGLYMLWVKKSEFYMEVL